MDVSFADIIDKFLVAYKDDLAIYSKDENDHCAHQEKIFTKDFNYSISLNPRKCNFGVTKGTLLGHLVGKEGVRIDLERVEAIDKI